MSILILDDMETRHKEFTRIMKDRLGLYDYNNLVHHVWTAEQAIERIGAVEFGQVFLDHDLSENDIMVGIHEKSEVTTGMEVVDFICGMDSPPLDVIIHSCNGPAAVEMERRLMEAHGERQGFRVRRVPFPHLLHLLETAR